jgi:hypothetical protein
MSIPTIDAVECLICKKLIRADSEFYITFLGNVLVGKQGGLIGNNFDEDGKVISATCVCRNQACLDQLVKYFLGTGQAHFGMKKVDLTQPTTGHEEVLDGGTFK